MGNFVRLRIVEPSEIWPALTGPSEYQLVQMHFFLSELIQLEMCPGWSSDGAKRTIEGAVVVSFGAGLLS